MAGQPKKRARRADLQWSKEQRALAEEAVRRIRARKEKQQQLELVLGQMIGSLHPKQLEFFRSDSKKRVARCSRRAGKTHLSAIGLIDAAVRTPGILVPYITLSIKNARRILWSTLRELERQWAMGMEFLENQLTVKLPNGSQIILGGCQDPGEVDKFRGPAYSRVIIDEAQSIKTSILETLVNDVLEAALLDHDGELWLCGTPSATCSGYFYDADQLKRSPFESHYWTLLENPHLPGAKAWLERAIEENGWDDENPTYRREYLGEWTRDENTLVYRFSRKRNLVDELPDETWQTALGIDLGFVDSTAFIVVAWSEDVAETYVIHAEKHQGYTSDDIARKVQQLDSEYSFDRMCADTGALGKMIIEEINKRYSLSITPAEKSKKHDHIELLNSDFQKGKFLIVDNPDTRCLVDELELLEWDPMERQKGKFVERSDCENHAADAMLYVWRESLGYLHTPESEAIKFNSPEWFRAEEKRMEESALALVGDQDVPWWETQGHDPVMGRY